MAYERPPPEAYGRVTNPGRYAVLHAAASELVAELAITYEIDVTEADPLSAASEFGRDVQRLLRLVPYEERAAPVTIGFTDFPGVIVRFGRWHTRAFPHCGCDACREQPDDVEADLRRYVHAVAAGGFREEIVNDFRVAEFVGEDVAARSLTRLTDAQRRELGDAERWDWRRWTLQ